MFHILFTNRLCCLLGLFICLVMATSIAKGKPIGEPLEASVFLPNNKHLVYTYDVFDSDHIDTPKYQIILRVVEYEAGVAYLLVTTSGANVNGSVELVQLAAREDGLYAIKNDKKYVIPLLDSPIDTGLQRILGGKELRGELSYIGCYQTRAGEFDNVYRLTFMGENNGLEAVAIILVPEVGIVSVEVSGGVRVKLANISMAEKKIASKSLDSLSKLSLYSFLPDDIGMEYVYSVSDLQGNFMKDRFYSLRVIEKNSRASYMLETIKSGDGLVRRSLVSMRVSADSLVLYRESDDSLFLMNNVSQEGNQSFNVDGHITLNEISIIGQLKHPTGSFKDVRYVRTINPQRGEYFLVPGHGFIKLIKDGFSYELTHMKGIMKETEF